MVADVPVGAFLSGGVDSSAVVGLMCRHATGPVKTFSLGFRVGGYNELADARRVAAYFGTDHHELAVDHLDLEPVLQTLVYAYDEPFADAACFPLYLLSRFAREQVKVALAGDGGDELFGGYRRYVADQGAALFQRLPGWAQARTRDLVAHLPRLPRLKRTLAAWSTPDPALRYAGWLWLFTPELQAALLAPALWAQMAGYDPAWPYRQYRAQSDRLAADDPLNRLLYTDVKSWLVDTYLEKTDKATMACSLEARLPLLDHRLVELYRPSASSSRLCAGWRRRLCCASRNMALLCPRTPGCAGRCGPWPAICSLMGAWRSGATGRCRWWSSSGRSTKRAGMCGASICGC
jgi:asparagine synthase (glutamine-hydrolysing)